MKESGLVRNRSDLRQMGRVTRGDVLIRLIDQGLWSAAFFAFNLVAAAALSVADFASLTVCTSIGVIVAAVMRAYAVDGRVIAGSRNGLAVRQSVERASVVMSGLVGAAAATLISLSWLAAGGALTEWWLPLLAGMIVLADGPHYSATMYGLFIRAAIMAAAYVMVAGISSGLRLVGADVSVGPVWLLCLLGVWIIGLSSSRFIPWRNGPFPKRDVTFRLSAESLYSALGGQLGILIVFLTSPPDDTAGIRLAYSLIYAPIFMLVQGLSPLFLTKMAQLNLASPQRQLFFLKIWIGASAGGTIVSGCIGGILSISLWRGSNFEHVGPFLIPVGAAMLGSYVLDSALLLLRFKSEPKFTHRIRLVTVTVDVVFQLALALSNGSHGLVLAMYAGFAMKLTMGVALLWRNRRVARV